MKENITRNKYNDLDLIKRQKNLISVMSSDFFFNYRDYCTASDGFT